MLYQVLDLADHFPESERFGIWHDHIAQSVGPQVTATEHPKDFDARFVHFNLGQGVSVNFFQYPSLSSTRGQRQISQGDPETWQVALPMAGTSIISQETRHSPSETLIHPLRNFTLIDSSYPYEAHHRVAQPDVRPNSERKERPRAGSVQVSIPREFIRLRPDRVIALAGARLDSTRGMGALLAQKLLYITGHPDEFSDNYAWLLRRQIVDLVSATIGQMLSERLSDEELHRVLRYQISSFIKTHYRDRQLDVPTIAAAHSISVRQVHRLFEGGPSVTDEIRTRRLESCRRDLEDPRCDEMTILEIARRNGITGALSRTFTLQYGLTPTQYRERHSSGQNEDPSCA